MIAAVGGFEEAAPGAFQRSIDTPGWTARLPHGGINYLRILRFEGEIRGSDIGSFVEDFLPGSAAVGGTIYAAFSIGAVCVAERSDIYDIGIAWMN
ncbi:MAG TPA: hypothetical protein VNX70_05680 [Bryobacteraceae bacterium]|nr:hypothetical protein [Bryobacteraceae bacterium]